MVSTGAVCLASQQSSALHLNHFFQSTYVLVIIRLRLLAMSFAMNMHSIPRAAERKPLSLMVKSRVRSRVVFVDLIDISEGGCKIKARAGFANVGDRVVMKVNGINAPLGTIAWVEGETAGVAFEGQMHAAIIDYLCTENGAKLTDFDPQEGVKRA